jgi:hypothetical protein
LNVQEKEDLASFYANCDFASAGKLDLGVLPDMQSYLFVAGVGTGSVSALADKALSCHAECGACIARPRA